MKIENVGLIGRGAVGTLFGNMIHKKLGKEHFSIIASKERCERYTSQPFYCNHEICDFRYASAVDEFKKLDLLIIVVKYPILADALETVKSFIKEDTIIISLLNGITSEAIVEDTLKKGIVIHSIAQLMDAVKCENEVTYSNVGEIVLGTNDANKQEALQSCAQFFESVHIPYYIADDIIHDQWSKLMLNCGINQICAVYDVPYGGCQVDGELRDKFIATMKEVALVAAYEGISLTETEIMQWVNAVDKLSADAMPSMRQDRLAKRYSEVDLFSKTIIKLSEKHQIDVPMNRFLYDKIKVLEETY